MRKLLFWCFKSKFTYRTGWELERLYRHQASKMIYWTELSCPLMTPIMQSEGKLPPLGRRFDDIE